MTACAVAALTVYDMVKGIERGVEIEQVVLLEKSGGRSDWRSTSRATLSGDARAAIAHGQHLQGRAASGEDESGDGSAELRRSGSAPRSPAREIVADDRARIDAAAAPLERRSAAARWC